MFNAGDFEPVCISLDAATILLPERIFMKCTMGHNFSESECIDAASSVGGELHDRYFLA